MGVNTPQWIIDNCANMIKEWENHKGGIASTKCPVYNAFDDKLNAGYEEYLKLPTATITTTEVELYAKGWYVMTGMSIVAPNPHRHYTLLEFVYNCGKNSELYDRFVANKKSDADRKMNHIQEVSNTIDEEFLFNSQYGGSFNTRETRQRLKHRLEEVIPFSVIKCDEECNPSAFIDKCCIVAKVSWKENAWEKFTYLVFGQKDQAMEILQELSK